MSTSHPASSQSTREKLEIVLDDWKVQAILALTAACNYVIYRVGRRIEEYIVHPTTPFSGQVEMHFVLSCVAALTFWPSEAAAKKFYARCTAWTAAFIFANGLHGFWEFRFRPFGHYTYMYGPLILLWDLWHVIAFGTYGFFAKEEAPQGEEEEMMMM